LEALIGTKPDINMGHCKIGKSNKCMKNIAKIICEDGIREINNNGDTKYLYDFIALQEINVNPNQWPQLENEINEIQPNFLKNYCHSSTRYLNGSIMTFYNINYYTLMKKIHGNFNTINTSRVYEILIFYENIIYINLHAPPDNELKNGDFKIDVINILNTKLDEVKTYLNGEFINSINIGNDPKIGDVKVNDTYKNKLDYFKGNLFDHYRIIISGDFNRDISVNEVNQLHYNKFKKQPSLQTCCNPNDPTYPHRYDHILDNVDDKFEFKLIPNLDKYKLGTVNMSDHLPVLGILKKREFNCLPIDNTNIVVIQNIFTDMYTKLLDNITNAIVLDVKDNKIQVSRIPNLPATVPLHYTNLDHLDRILDELVREYSDYPSIVTTIESLQLFRRLSLLDIYTIVSYKGIPDIIFNILLNAFGITNYYYSWQLYNRAQFRMDQQGHNNIYLEISKILNNIFKKSKPTIDKTIAIRTQDGDVDARPNIGQITRHLQTPNNQFIYTQAISISYQTVFMDVQNPPYYLLIEIPKNTQLINIELIAIEREILLPKGIVLENDCKITDIDIDDDVDKKLIKTNQIMLLDNCIKNRPNNINYFKCTNCITPDKQYYQYNLLENIDTILDVNNPNNYTNNNKLKYIDNEYAIMTRDQNEYKKLYFDKIKEKNPNFDDAEMWLKKYIKNKSAYDKIKNMK
jgi:hypothetical protein